MPRFIGDASQARGSRSAERIAIVLTMCVIVLVWVILVRARIAQTISAAVEQLKHIATETASVRTEVNSLKEPVIELKRAPQEASQKASTTPDESPVSESL